MCVCVCVCISVNARLLLVCGLCLVCAASLLSYAESCPHVSTCTVCVCVCACVCVQGVRAFDNPLASSFPRDVEGGRCGVMPPVPHVAVDRLLRRAAERIGGKVREPTHTHTHTHTRQQSSGSALFELCNASSNTQKHTHIHTRTHPIPSHAYCTSHPATSLTRHIPHVCACVCVCVYVCAFIGQPSTDPQVVESSQSRSQ